MQEQQRQELTLSAPQPGEGSEPTEIANVEPNNPELPAEDGSTTPAPETQPKPFRASKSLDQIDPANIPEFRPMNSLPPSGDQHQDIQSGQQSPYYPGYYTEQGYYPAPSRPNLYLYSPSNNTLIPCEEIIIPNPAVSGEGPVYPGPTNIYLAYPVSGPDGRGYITQPFSPPLPQEYMSYQSYSPSISDGSHYHSSTPQTPNSGHDSGSSTQPASPPPLVNYHPANWFQREAKTPDFLQNRSEPEVQVLDSRSRNVKTELSNSSSPDIPTVQYIPGLPPQVQATTPKKSQKKKKKKKPQSDHRDSLSSESELSRIYGSGQETGNTLTNNSSPVLEVNLTDDLADFMVNPPTEPECSDEETLRNSSGALNQGLKRDDTILNLKDLPNDLSNLELETFQYDHDPQNLVDSGIEKDLEEMLISDLESKRSLKSDSDDSFEMVSTTIPPVPEPVKDFVPEVEEFEEENVISFECDDLCVEPVPISTPTNQKPDLVEPLVKETDNVEVSVEPHQVVEVLEKELEVQEITTPVVAPLETESLIPEPNQGPLYTAESSQLSDSLNVPAKPRKKRTKKKTANVVLTPEKSEITPELQDIPTENANKMSYSAVCKTSDHKMNTSQQTQEPETDKKPAPVVPVQEREIPKSVHTPVDLKPEEWETVPHALSNPGNWEKKQKKNKKKKLSTVSFEEIPEIIETQEVHEDLTERKEEMPDLELIIPADPVRVERLQTPEIELKPEEECEEKKKNKKKKKKHGSEEPEEKQHKILICDNQVNTSVVTQPPLYSVNTPPFQPLQPLHPV